MESTQIVYGGIKLKVTVIMKVYDMYCESLDSRAVNTTGVDFG